MRIAEALADGRRSFSFEFSPPRTPAGMRTLMRELRIRYLRRRR
jgi:5,10-methylenetetrahydrofolate reductase